MSTLNLVLSILVFVVVTLVFFVFAFPETSSGIRRRVKIRKGPLQPHGKDWQATALKLERYIVSLRKKIDWLKGGQKKMEQDLVIEKARNAKLKDQISKEKEWLQKEKESLEGQDQQIYELNQRARLAEEEREKEYGLRLRIERECKEIKQDLSAVEKERNALTARAIQAESELSRLKDQIIEIKRVNRELEKESDEASFIAKSEYEKLVDQLKEKEKELERITRESNQ
ncbi:MAG: hypothetical protein ABIJ41_01355 [Candidatus Omnitrophota bacterium]